MRSIVRIRSCQGASLVSRMTGRPFGGVMAGKPPVVWLFEGVITPAGGTKAEPSGSAGASAVSPSGTANSEVGCSSSGGGGRGMPRGGVKALCASSDNGFWFSPVSASTAPVPRGTC